MMVPLLLLAISFHSDFEGGSLGKVERVTPTHYRCALKGESDQNGRNRQASWYYFRIDDAPRDEVTIDLVDLVGEYNYHRGTHSVTSATRPVYSYDRKTWRRFENVTWDEKAVELRLRFTPERGTLWIAHLQPYTNQDLTRLLSEFRSNPQLSKEVAGKSAGGRDIILLTITDRSVPDDRKKVVWVMARQHSWEAGTSWTLEGALRYLLSQEPSAERVRRQFVFKVFPMADPDGVARGGVRFNANGYDLNRNWDAIDPALMPEIAAMHKAMLDWVDSGQSIHLFLTLHNQEGTDLLEGPLTGCGPTLPGVAEQLARRLRETALFYAPGSPRDSGASTSSEKGRMAVYQALCRERMVPSLLLELTVEATPKLHRPPDAADWLDFGGGLVRAINGVIASAPDSR